MADIKLTKYIQKVFETPSIEGSEWFGYYNYDTLNSDQTKMLCNRAKFDGVAPEIGMKIELGYYDIPSGVWHHIGETDSWNWQQGAMMQWLSDDKIIYNCSKDNHLVSKIFDPNTGKTKDISWSIYGINPDGKKSITLEMERSYWCRAYHYQSVANPDQEGDVIESDGIFEIDLESNNRKRIISIQDIIKEGYRPYFEDCKHWIEHIMISKNGKYFCFLHRFSPETDVFKYETRICIANIDGSNLHVIPDWKKYEWSHFGWSRDNAFSVYTVKTNAITGKFKIADRKEACNTKTKPTINWLLMKGILFVKNMLPPSVRRMIKGQQNYYQFYSLDDNYRFVLNKDLKSNLFKIDGHPSFTNDGKYMITDTYPDNKGFQHLIVYNVETGKGLIIAEFKAFYYGNPASCDLHPKLSSNNDYVVVDSAYNEKHHMIMLKFNWNLIIYKLS